MKNIILLLLILPLLCLGQFNDNFSDGDFTQNPQWIGDQSLFVVENNILKLNSVSGNDSTYLSTASSIINDTEWNFWVRLAFTPSNNNHPRIYLVSDNANLRAPLNGYFLRIGKDGTDNKRIYFFRQSGTTATEIFTGATNIASGTNNILRIKVTRNAAGVWNFFCDPQGGQAFVSQGSVSDNTHTSTSWFGVLCKYTSSNINKFYFDDFYVGPIIVDVTPPSITAVSAISANQLEVTFSEAVELNSAENTNHYNVNLGIGNPFLAERSSTNFSKVTLHFTNNFTQALTYTLTATNISDLNNNIMGMGSMPFTFFTPSLHDVVFNELMADPTPVVGLPEYEYIELYNRTNLPVNIKNWILRHGTTDRTLPDAIIPPDSFIVLTSPAAFPHLSSYGNVVEVTGLSTTALTNAGTTLVLLDNNNEIIHAVAYSETWYADNSKKDGGWSLEQIDPNNPCGGSQNWKASINPSGGTPGRRNSINASNTDITPPEIVRIGVIDSVTIEVFFSERMKLATINNVQDYTIDNNIGQPIQLTQNAPLYQSVVLKLNAQILPQTTYKLTVSNTLEDCVGNLMGDKNFAFFGLSEKPLPNDIVINEILFNPPTNGVDFVEIYNRSNKIIDLIDLRLTSKDTIINELTSIRVITEGSYLMFPGEYIVLTTHINRVTNFFYAPLPNKIISMSSLPAFNNASGIAVLADIANVEIDMLIYDEKMHYPLLTTYKGVSLERIHYDRPSNDKTNWHSAAAGVGYATPTYKNSQFGQFVSADDAISLYPDIFSPDNDGHNDVLNIAYKFEEPGYVANIMIYDARGRQIRYLVKNELLGTEGVFSWDGITDGNLKATIGIYIVYVEVFNTKGDVKKYKKTTVLGGKLSD